ncbi:DNA gyrase subunit A [Alphaproteobacteria bacterium]
MTNQSSTVSLGIVPTSIETEMQKSYLDYAMSVITSRALPDCRDGLKPVHRRVLYAMHATSNTHDKPYRKSARVVGEVMGKYHPHGDGPIYSSIVRMTQSFSLLTPLIDGQGNFGSIDGDSPAQMRYTEIRLAKIASQCLLKDIEEDTVGFQDNYDNSEQEPKVLPSRFPNLLVNGANGIAVGMATNIPTHNLGEVIDGCCAYLENEHITAAELLEHIPAPDFPTGGTIIGYAKVQIALTTGRGSIMVHGKASVEAIENRKAIVITEIPYQVNKSELVKSIEVLARNKVVEGITEIRDESNKLGIRVVVEFRKDVEGEVLLNKLYHHTDLACSFGVNMLALKEGQPLIMNVRDIIATFIKFREEVVTKRTAFLLQKARNKAHILLGLLVAIDSIDEVVRIIRSSTDPKQARLLLITAQWPLAAARQFIALINDKRIHVIDDKMLLTNEQAQAILDMRLQRLTGLESSKITKELEELCKEITEYIEILGSRTKLVDIIREELLEIKKNFATPRLTNIVQSSKDALEEDLIQQEDMVVTITKSGYIKRTPLKSYHEQKRGGRGKIAMSVYEDDAVIDVIVTNTHCNIIFFSDIGKAYKLKVYKLPLGSLQSKGRALVNILPLASQEKITSVLALQNMDSTDDAGEEDFEKNYIVFATAKGNARRNALSDFANIQSSGKIAIRLGEDDKLVGVVLCKKDDHMLLATKQGKAIRFAVGKLRVFKSRTSDGVRAVNLSKANDAVISLSVLTGIAIEQEQREAYLRIPLEDRLFIAAESQQEVGKIALDLANQAVIKLNDLANVIASESKIDAAGVVKFAQNEQLLLTITDNGFGKLTSAYEYRVTGRGGKGIMNIALVKKKGSVISAFPVQRGDSIVILTNLGVLIRMSVDGIRVTGRHTAGVRVMNLQDSDFICSVSKVVESSK